MIHRLTSYSNVTGTVILIHETQHILVYAATYCMFEMRVLHFKIQLQNKKIILLQEVVLSLDMKPLHATALKISQHPCAFKLIFMFHLNQEQQAVKKNVLLL